MNYSANWSLQATQIEPRQAQGIRRSWLRQRTIWEERHETFKRNSRAFFACGGRGDGALRRQRQRRGAVRNRGLQYSYRQQLARGIRLLNQSRGFGFGLGFQDR